MVLTESDIVINTTTGTKFFSLGGNRSDNVIKLSNDRTKNDEYVHNLYDRIRPEDIINARSTYRCIAIRNQSSDDDWENVKAWIVQSGGYQSEVTVEIQKETVASNKVQQVGDEYTTPTGITFKTPTSKSHADVIDMGTITKSDGWCGLWIKRTPTVSVKGRTYEEVTIRVEGDDEPGSASYVGKNIRLIWNVLTDEVQEVLQRLNDIPVGRVNLRGAQEAYDDALTLVNRSSSSNATDAEKRQAAMSRAMYLVYQEYTVEIERAGGGLPPMVVSRVYELRRVANEMMNSIMGTTQRMTPQIIKGRSWRGRTW